MNSEIIEKFKNKELKAKSIFKITEIDKKTAYDFVKLYHYLKDAKFFSAQAFGLYCGDELVGVATYSQPQGIVALKGWFGVDNSHTDIYELSRLCMNPHLNGTNATSFLLGGSIRILKKQKKIRAIITLADASRHIGSIYQICNFKYYGLTDKKTDFYCVDGRVNPRGQTKKLHGVWLPRSRKHRYCYILDNSLKVKYKEQEAPKEKGVMVKECCGGTLKVFDARFKEWHPCPRCVNKSRKIEEFSLF